MGRKAIGPFERMVAEPPKMRRFFIAHFSKGVIKLGISREL